METHISNLKRKNNKLRSKEKKTRTKTNGAHLKKFQINFEVKKMLERDHGRIFTFPTEFRAERSHQQIVCKFFGYSYYIFWLIILSILKQGAQ